MGRAMGFQPELVKLPALPHYLNYSQFPPSFFKKLFLASGMVLTPLPEVYILYGEGCGIRTRVRS
jgi:hypothetical protein